MIADSQHLVELVRDQDKPLRQSIVFGTNYFLLPRIMMSLWQDFADKHSGVEVISRMLPLELGYDAAGGAEIIESTEYVAEPWKARYHFVKAFDVPLTIAGAPRDPVFEGLPAGMPVLRTPQLQGRTVIVPPMGISEGTDAAILFLQSSGAQCEEVSVYSPTLGIEMLANRKLVLSNGAWADFFPGTVQARIPGDYMKGYGFYVANNADALALEFVNYMLQKLDGKDYADFFPASLSARYSAQ